MQFLENFAGCVFCDVSYFAVAWFALLGFVAIIGFVLSLLLIWKTLKKKELTSAQAKWLSASYSMILSTTVVYSLTAVNENINEYGNVPLVFAIILSVIGYFVLSRFDFSKTSLLTALTLSIVGYFAYMTVVNTDDRILNATYLLVLVIALLILVLLKKRHILK